MKQGGGKDCLSVGMKLPNGTYERPIQKARLFWVRPGKLDKPMITPLVLYSIDFTLSDIKVILRQLLLI